MISKRFCKKAAIAMLGLTLMGALAACGSSKKAEGSSKKDASLTGIITFGGNATAIKKATWFTKIIKEETGITLNFQDDVSTSAGQIMQSLLASGELPDIVGFSSRSDAQNASKAGLLLNLDDYKDKLPNIYKNENLKNAIAYGQDTLGGKDNGLYAMGTAIGVQNEINFNPQLRWDIYKKIGKPKISTLEDYLPVLKQMQEANPTTANGEKIYALSLFNGWDTHTMALAAYLANFYGVNSQEIQSYTEVPTDGKGDIKSILANDSVYKRVLDFYYEANQEGLIDPDSLTQKWDTVLDKYNNGRILFSPWQWATVGFNTTENTSKDDFEGYQSVWADDFTVPINQDNPTGDVRTIGISSACENVDAALKFLNYFYSYDCENLIYNGPEGQLWEKDADGLKYVTDEGFDILDNSKALKGGGTIADAFNIINASPMTPQTIDPNTKDQTISNTYWDSTLNRDIESNKLVQDWRADHDGAIDMLHYSQEKNQNLVKTNSAFNLMGVAPDSMQSSITQIGDIVKTYSWKMVFAKDKSEYNQLWKEMQTKAKGLGIDDVVASRTKEFNKAIEISSKYNK